MIAELEDIKWRKFEDEKPELIADCYSGYTGLLISDVIVVKNADKIKTGTYRNHVDSYWIQDNFSGFRNEIDIEQSMWIYLSELEEVIG